jgi:proteic killer suppression protein
MIRSFRHRGLKRLHERGDNSRIPAERLERIENILFTLDNAQTLKEMRLPRFWVSAVKL